jgi:phosphoheptose isomerase/phosphoglycolate phosphatase-like HAD superfamily hydrolase
MFVCSNQSDPELYAKETSNALLKTDFKILEQIADKILLCKMHNRTIFTVGNGGSAATASHMINDLMKGCRYGQREGFHAYCLNDPNAVITCLANDFSYEDIYRIMLRTVAKRGDVLIAFSGSGNSPNILSVCDEARKMGLTVVGFGGRDGGKMKALCDYCILAPTFSMEQIEDLHLIYVHALISHLRNRLETFWDIEVIHYPTGIKPEIVIFDFDGTVSLLREGWQPIMYEYFKEELLKCPDAPEPSEAEGLVTEFVDYLTGKQTIFQCMRLCEEIKRCGGNPKEPFWYKEEYLRRLREHIRDRHSYLRAGSSPDPYLVPGVKEVLRTLKELEVKCYLTSGTDEADVMEEAELLGVAEFFDGIHGATDANSTVCSKEEVLRELLKNDSFKGSQLIIFGDGYVEIELGKQVGAYTVAVATNEKARDTSVNEWKRKRLLTAGADCIIPDFTNPKRLINFLFGR